MSTRVELYRFTEVGLRDPFDGNQNFYFILDKSGSMEELVAPGVTRMDVAKQQMKAVLDEIDRKRIEKNVTVHIGICAFSGSISTIVRRSADTAAVAELKAFIDGIATVFDGTNYNLPLVQARSYFLTPTPSDFRQSCFFITDGEPNPVSSAADAASNCADMIGRTGSFSPSTGNDVDIYCLSVDLYNTTYLGLLDNTPRDGIPVLSSTNSDAMYNAILSAVPTESEVWTYTSGDTAVTYMGETYEPIPLGRSETETKNELSRANIEVKLDLDNEMGKRWLHDLVETLVGLTIFEKDEDGEIGIVWKGRLSGLKPSMSEIVLNFESVFTSLRRPGLRARYQRSCRHMLYSRGCGVSKEAWAVNGVPTAVNGAVVTVPEAAAYPAGYFATGMLEGPDGTLRFIVAHSGSQLTLIRPFVSLAKALALDGYGLSYGKYYGGVKVRLFPGCDRTRNTCLNRFNNLNNYGGFDWIPLRNPFDGSSIV